MMTTLKALIAVVILLAFLVVVAPVMACSPAVSQIKISLPEGMSVLSIDDGQQLLVGGKSAQDIYEQLNSQSSVPLESVKEQIISTLNQWQSHQPLSLNVEFFNQATVDRYEAEKIDKNECYFTNYERAGEWLITHQQIKGHCKHVWTSDGSCGFTVNYLTDPPGTEFYQRVIRSRSLMRLMTVSILGLAFGGLAAKLFLRRSSH